MSLANLTWPFVSLVAIYWTRTFKWPRLYSESNPIVSRSIICTRSRFYLIILWASCFGLPGCGVLK